jgi:hypothetical protein
VHPIHGRKINLLMMFKIGLDRTSALTYPYEGLEREVSTHKYPCQYTKHECESIVYCVYLRQYIHV